MTITSLAFALFCIVSIVFYWLLPARYRLGWLFAISIAFLLTWAWDLAGDGKFFLGRVAWGC
jgi:hypothetical protein